MGRVGAKSEGAVSERSDVPRTWDDTADTWHPAQPGKASGARGSRNWAGKEQGRLRRGHGASTSGLVDCCLSQTQLVFNAEEGWFLKSAV